jgi:methylthioribose-1-phosphate isomerase
MNRGFRTIRYDAARHELIVLDQTKLPGRASYVRLKTPGDVYRAIRGLKVRGAPLLVKVLA